MPFKSDAQRRLMYAVASDPKLAKEKGISKEVAEEFINADHAEHESGHKKMKKIIDKGVDEAASGRKK